MDYPALFDRRSPIAKLPIADVTCVNVRKVGEHGGFEVPVTIQNPEFKAEKAMEVLEQSKHKINLFSLMGTCPMWGICKVCLKTQGPSTNRSIIGTFPM